MPLQLYLFGPPRLERDGNKLDVSRRKLLALFAYLAVTGRSHSQVDLAALLWPDCDLAEARTNLGRELFHLLQLVGGDSLVITDSSAGFHPEDGFWLDVTAFREHLAVVRAHDHGTAALCEPCATHLVQAVTLFQEPFLAGFSLSGSPAFQEWLSSEAGQLNLALRQVRQQLENWHSTRREYEYETNSLLAATRYIREEHIATGGQGEVYRGRDRQTGDTVIIKRLRPEMLLYPDRVARFVREGETLRQLAHPNIVRLLDRFELDGQQHIVMEYVAGGTLDELLQREGVLPPERALPLALELADALIRAHHLGIIHRDIKPANVLLAPDGSPRLTDFGTAHLLDLDSRLTLTGAFVGSPAYTSPEALEGDLPDSRSDIWSFGVLLFEMLAGERPFTGDQLAQVMVNILNQPAPRLDQVQPGLPAALVTLVAGLLEKEPARRPAGMRQVAAALETIASSLQRPGAVVSGGPLPLPLPPAASSPAEHTGTPASAIPRPSTTFVGRQQELREIERLLEQPDSRLLTLLGPGGMGKTRLALEVAHNRLVAGGPVAFVPLAPLADATAMAPTIATHLGLPQGSNPRQQILDYLHSRRLLLILDNVEHLLTQQSLAQHNPSQSEAAALIHDLLQAAPGVTILVTSRELLRLSSEKVLRLSGLSYPDAEADTAVDSYDAVALLLQEVRRIQPDFRPAPSDLVQAVRLCQLVGGMPLALVLAGSWLSLLSLQEIADEVAQNLDILESDAPDLPVRQRSARAVFDYSWQCLSPREQEIFLGLSVFRGGFARQAAASVTGASLSDLRSLLNRSLIFPVETGRYEVHELLRQFGEERLGAGGLALVARDAHARYYLTDLAKREPDLRGGRQVETLEEIENDLDNVRTAWLWAGRQRRYSLVDQAMESLHFFLDLRGRYAEGAQLFSCQCAQFPLDGPAETRRVALRLHPRRAFLQLTAEPRPWPALVAEVEQCMTYGREMGELLEVALCQEMLGSYTLYVHNDPARALALLEEARSTYQAIGDHFANARILMVTSSALHVMGQLGQLEAVLKEALVETARHNNLMVRIFALANLAEIYLAQGRMAEAEQLLAEVVAVGPILPLPGSFSGSQQALALFLRGDLDGAREVLGPARRLAERLTHPYVMATAWAVEALLAAVAGSAEEAAELARRSRQVPTNHGLVLVVTNLALVLAALGQDEDQEARSFLAEAFRLVLDLDAATVLWLLPAASVLLSRLGHLEQAARLGGQIASAPPDAVAWARYWSLFTRSQAAVAEQLGQAAYLEAWTAGRKRGLDLREIAEWVLEII